jgi:hypothetical protein
VVIKPIGSFDEQNGSSGSILDIDRESYDAELEDIPRDAVRTPLLRPTPNNQMLPRTRSKQRLVSYQNDRNDTTISSNSESSSTGLAAAAGECLVCLEEFSLDNPQMPTLCACGDNRALFHYPCLLTYLEGKKTCPICNRELYYQEFDVK